MNTTRDPNWDNSTLDQNEEINKGLEEQFAMERGESIHTNSQDSIHSQDEKILNEVMKEFEEKMNVNKNGFNEFCGQTTGGIPRYNIGAIKDFIKQAITKAQKIAREEMKNKFLTDKSIQHTLKLVPSSQRDLFISEIIKKL